MKHKFSSMGRVAIALVLALSLSLVMAVPVSAVGALTGVGATPENDMAGATTTYTIAFKTAATGETDVASVDMKFADGFDVKNAALSGTATGIEAGTVGVDGQTVTYTVAEVPPPAIVAETVVTITLSGIVNPSAGTYPLGVTITTKNLAGGAIDTGSAEVTITAAPVSFLVETQNAGTEAAGTPFTVKITALDADGGIEADYTGDHLIDFSSTATDATIPAFEVVNFTNPDGVGTTVASFVLNKVGTGKTITATDNDLVPPVKGTSAPITVGLAAFDYVTITDAPASVIAGVAFTDDITVTAYDAAGNVMTTDSTSNIVWSSTESGTPADVLPADHLLDEGTWTFSGSGFTLKKAGALSKTVTLPRTITATVDGLRRVASIIVNPAPASKLDVTASEPTIDANGFDSSVITATVMDEFGNLVKTSTDITFETSVGEFANGASTYTVAFAYHGSPDYDYYAEATLTSTDGGLATIKVTSGTLTYDTVSVELTADPAPTEVWVDDDYDTGLYNDGHDWEYDAFKTIEGGIGAVAAGGTVNVAPGLYKPNSTLSLGKNGVTLQATGTVALTKIEPTAGDPAIRITGDDVTVEGFTIKPNGVFGISVFGSDGAIVHNNTITSLAPYVVGIVSEAVATDTNISDNTLVNANIYLTAGDNTVSGNKISGTGSLIIDGGITLQGGSDDNIITGNAISGLSAGEGILFHPGASGTVDNNLIQGNTISNSADGIVIGDGFTVTKLVITGNTITDNGDAGIKISADVTWGTGNTINNNNISGNLNFGVQNSMTSATIINAETNWWGQASGPVAGQVDGLVDYTPWRTSEYTEPVAPVTTIDLVAGWNLISLPLIPEDPAILTVLDGVDVVKVAGYSPFQEWKYYTPGFTSNLEQMNDGWGYWVDMGTTTATLTISGYEVCKPAPAVPPDYDLAVGWNLIGFKSTTSKTILNYLGPAIAGTDGTLEVIYGYNASTGYFIPTNLEPGAGYWLAVNDTGVIYP